MTRRDGPRVGMTAETSHLVEREQTAPHLGSGDLAVYATPAMAALAERLCAEMVEPSLADDQTTVGVHLDIQHLAPTPVGARVKAHARLEAVEGHQLSFRVDVRDDHELVGEIQHKRAIVDVPRFMRRVRAKQSDRS